MLAAWAMASAGCLVAAVVLRRSYKDLLRKLPTRKLPPLLVSQLSKLFLILTFVFAAITVWAGVETFREHAELEDRQAERQDRATARREEREQEREVIQAEVEGSAVAIQRLRESSSSRVELARAALVQLRADLDLGPEAPQILLVDGPVVSKAIRDALESELQGFDALSAQMSSALEAKDLNAYDAARKELIIRIVQLPERLRIDQLEADVVGRARGIIDDCLRGLGGDPADELPPEEIQRRQQLAFEADALRRWLVGEFREFMRRVRASSLALGQTELVKGDAVADGLGRDELTTGASR